MSDPYAAPAADISAPVEEGEHDPKVLSFKGRIGRLRYFAWGFVYNIILYIPIILLAVVAPNLLGEESSMAAPLGILILILVLVPTFVLMKRRLQDLDKSAWFFLLFLVPIVNILFILYVMCWPGTAGNNRFGLPARQSTAVVWLAVGALVLSIIGIVSIVLSPEVRDILAAASAASN